MSKRYILTGAPGTGKTSLINALKQQGYACHDEIARQIILRQQQQGGNKTPWEDLIGFVNLVYEQTLKELNIPVTPCTFVDRGLPDCMAYLKASACKIPERLSRFPFKSYYQPIVFLAPPWEAIYTNDPQRPQSLQDAALIHKHLVDVYQDLNFTLKILPKATLTQRVAFIQSII